jgi:hypothetical protein
VAVSDQCTSLQCCCIICHSQKFYVTENGLNGAKIDDDDNKRENSCFKENETKNICLLATDVYTYLVTGPLGLNTIKLFLV